jgi:hypothetical protein
MSKLALPSFSILRPNYPTDLDSDKVIHQIGGEATESWVGPNSCVMRMSKAFNYAGKNYEIPATLDELLTVEGADGKNYAIRVTEFIQYLHKQYRNPDLIKKGSEMKAESFRNKTGIIAWLIDGWSDARGHFTLWDGSKGLFEGEHHYFDDFGPSAPKGGPHIVQVQFWTC